MLPKLRFRKIIDLMKTRKPTPAEFAAYTEFVSPRYKTMYMLMAEKKYDEAKVLRTEIDQYCFANKVALRPTGMRIIK